MQRAVEQDPLNATWHAIWAAHLIDVPDHEAAIAAATKAIALDPHYFVAEHLLGEALAASGDVAGALRQYERAYALAPWNAVATGLLAAALAHRGDTAAAVRLVEAMGDAPMPLWGRVVYHLNISELDEAADWYERMIEHRDPFAVVYAMGEITKSLRAHPRWARLAALMHRPR